MVDKNLHKLYNYIMITLAEKLVCLFKGHDVRFAGSCPYTQKTYDVCLRCNKTFLAMNFAEDIDKEDI
jgi:hypothetical protein